MREQVPRLLIAVGALALGVLLTSLLIGTGAPNAGDGAQDPRALVWRHELASIEGGGLFGLDQMAPLPDRVVAVRSIWNEAAQRDDGRVISSADGVSWTLAGGPIQDIPIQAVASVDGAAWAFGPLAEGDGEQEIWRSIDGLTWRRIDGIVGIPAGPGRFMTVAGSGSTMVAITSVTIDAETFDVHVLASEDGRGWITVPQPRGPVYGLRTIVGNPSGFTALFAFDDGVGSNFVEAWQSRDGRAWTQHPVAGPELVLNLSDTARGLGGQVAVGLLTERGADFMPAAWFSRNGQLWTRGAVESTPDATFGGIDQVVAYGSGFVAFGDAGTGDAPRELAWASTEGSTWQLLAPWPVGSEREDVEGAAVWGERVLATGQTSDENGRGIPMVWIGEAPR